MKLIDIILPNMKTAQGRSRLVTWFTMLCNFVWSGCKILFGIITGAYFFCVNGAGTLVMGFAKRVYIKNHREESVVVRCTKAVAMNVMLMGIGACYVIYMSRLLSADYVQPQYHLIIAIVFALVATIETVFAVRNLIKAFRSKDPMLMALRRINTSSAIFAIVLTQVAMLSALDTFTALPNALTGMFSGVIVLGLGLYGLVKDLATVKSQASAVGIGDDDASAL